MLLLFMEVGLVLSASSPFGLAAQGTGVRTPSTTSPIPVAKLEFEVASVKENRTGEAAHSNFPLNPGVQFGTTGGLLSAHNMVLLQYFVFAYKMTSYQIQSIRAQFPDWARMDHFDIEARTSGEPSKDEMREMMQALLVDRFKMKVHHEIRQVPVFALVPSKAGTMGPQLKPHPVDDPDCTKTPLPKSIVGGYPAGCGAGASIPASLPGRTAIGGRKVTMQTFVVGLTNLGNNVDRPVIDKTGYDGAFDYTLEWAPEESGSPSGASTQLEMMGPSFAEALKGQLGLKLVPEKGAIDVIVLDHMEYPSAN